MDAACGRVTSLLDRCRMARGYGAGRGLSSPDRPPEVGSRRIGAAGRGQAPGSVPFARAIRASFDAIEIAGPPALGRRAADAYGCTSAR